MRERVDRLVARYLEYGNAEGAERVRAAAEFAAAAHGGQFRESGEPYVTHPLSVADIVADMQMDADSVAAALLHDTIEDTGTTKKDIKELFGPEVAELVAGLTKLARIPYSSKAEQEMENLRRMFIAMAKDIRVILIKLADRLHNMRTLDARKESKQREVALETMDVYCPIAHRLGIFRIKLELEDISLRYLDPVGYKEITDSLESTKTARDTLIENVRRRMAERFEEAGLAGAQIDGRVKHIYSIYRKMYAQNKSLDEIYDLCAVRIIVNTKDDCYNALGLLHDTYNPMPGRFKDYISTPKPNMYQSIHSTVIGREGIPFEVQIRTWEMHHVAEFGVAAHWKYKDGVTGSDDDYEKKVEWIRKMLENQEDLDAEDFVNSFKIDLFADDVYVFTPKGDVISLPAGASPIDFAYGIHSAVGNRMVGAKVNGRIVPIDSSLQNGDIVEILTSKTTHGPSRDWLKIARTNEARSKIRQWFKKERREENIEQGRDSLERELRREGVLISILDQPEITAPALKKLSFKTVDDMLAAIGYGGVTVQRVINRLREEYQKLKKDDAEEDFIAEIKPARRSESGVIVDGLDSCLVKFARCCTPVPGDGITGFVTRGYGVSVHRDACANVASLDSGARSAGERFVAVSWADEITTQFVAGIDIDAKDRVSLIADVTSQLASMRIPIHSFQTKKRSMGDALLSLTLTVTDKNHLDSVCSRLAGIRGVREIARSGVRSDRGKTGGTV